MQSVAQGRARSRSAPIVAAAALAAAVASLREALERPLDLCERVRGALLEALVELALEGDRGGVGADPAGVAVLLDGAPAVFLQAGNRALEARAAPPPGARAQRRLRRASCGPRGRPSQAPFGLGPTDAVRA